MLAFDQFDVLTFDCYGTLIDWETGIVQALQPVLRRHGHQLDADAILERYAQIEPNVQQDSFQNYKTVLRKVMITFAQELQINLSAEEENTLVASLPSWPPFYDTVSALKRFRKRFKLAIISNIDRDLFAQTNRALGVDFDWIVTAEDVQAYKPSPKNFEVALAQIGRPKQKILHVAQSLYHDIRPAKELGLKTVWVNRRFDAPGFGATPPAMAEPDLEVPDLTTLADLMGV